MSSDPGVVHHVLDGTSTVLVLEAMAVSGFRHELLVAFLALEALQGVPVVIPSVASELSSSSYDAADGRASGAVFRSSCPEDDALDHVLEFLAELAEVTDVPFADWTAAAMVSSVSVSAGVVALVLPALGELVVAHPFSESFALFSVVFHMLLYVFDHPLDSTADPHSALKAALPEVT